MKGQLPAPLDIPQGVLVAGVATLVMILVMVLLMTHAAGADAIVIAIVKTGAVVEGRINHHLDQIGQMKSTRRKDLDIKVEATPETTSFSSPIKHWTIHCSGQLDRTLWRKMKNSSPMPINHLNTSNRISLIICGTSSL